MARTKNRQSKSDKEERSSDSTKFSVRGTLPANPPQKRPRFLLTIIVALAIWVVFLFVAVASVWR